MMTADFNRHSMRRPIIALHRSPTLVGFANLAAAMGIARFALTPLLPFMQQSFGLTLAQGGWLAAVNYLGYLGGAILSIGLRRHLETMARWGLLAIALSTLGMGLTTSPFWWASWRFVSGLAGAFVLIGTSTWALTEFARGGRPHAAGTLFAGVGVGIAVAGLVALVAGVSGAGPQPAWVVLGLVVMAAAALAWPVLRASTAATSAVDQGASERFGPGGWLLIACYSAAGFGYIIPATYIPAAARLLIADPLIFGWAWPVFGTAAALSTLVATRWSSRATPRSLFGAALLLMGVGTLAPALSLSPTTLLLSALSVGGTFMLATMASMQEARRVLPHASGKLIATMTTGFALAQLAGPLLVNASRSSSAFGWPSVLAACLLLLASAVLLIRRNL